MSKNNLFVNASNMHQGGGKILLNAFLSGLLDPNWNYIVFIDKRYKPMNNLSNNIKFIKINGVIARFSVGLKIKKLLKFNDRVIYLGNLPPFIRFKCFKTYLLLSNRFYVDKTEMCQYPLKIRFKIFIEKLYFKIFITNISNLLVQTSTMYNLSIQYGIKKKISICAFDDYIMSKTNNLIEDVKEKNSFIYVASMHPHKNHLRLLRAFNTLKEFNLKLYITLDEKNKLAKTVLNFIKNNNLNVVVLNNIKRSDLIDYYKKSEALIYPSIFEAYGLPLIEAKRYKLKIIASDLDYAWDFIKPDYFFNPYDFNSIARAIKRYLNCDNKLDQILSPNEFVNKILN